MSKEDEKVDRGDEVKDEKDTTKDDEKKVDAKADEKADEKTDEDVDPAKAKKEALDDEDEKADKDKGVRIPKSRLDEVSRKAKAKEAELQSRLAELEEKIKASDKDAPKDPQTQIRNYREKIAELRDKYEELIFDGKKTEAKKARAELDNLEEALADYKIAIRADTARSQAEDNMRYNASLARLETEFPQLNPDVEDSYDEDVTDEVARLSNALVRDGVRPHLALEQAVKYVLGEGAKVREADASLKKKRDEDARKKAADADKKQPANMNKAGVDSDKAGTKDEGGIDVMKLGIKQFDKLSEETVKKMRGDVI